VVVRCVVSGGGRLVTPDNECWRQINFIPFLLSLLIRRAFQGVYFGGRLALITENW
jgi:hypothetical protein